MTVDGLEVEVEPTFIYSDDQTDYGCAWCVEGLVKRTTIDETTHDSIVTLAKI